MMVWVSQQNTGQRSSTGSSGPTRIVVPVAAWDFPSCARLHWRMARQCIWKNVRRVAVSALWCSSITHRSVHKAVFRTHRCMARIRGQFKRWPGPGIKAGSSRRICVKVPPVRSVQPLLVSPSDSANPRFLPTSAVSQSLRIAHCASLRRMRQLYQALIPVWTPQKNRTAARLCLALCLCVAMVAASSCSQWRPPFGELQQHHNGTVVPQHRDTK